MIFSFLVRSLRPDEFKFGCTSLRVPPELLFQLRNDITVSPSGIAFVKVRHPTTLIRDTYRLSPWILLH